MYIGYKAPGLWQLIQSITSSGGRDIPGRGLREDERAQKYWISEWFLVNLINESDHRKFFDGAMTWKRFSQYQPFITSPPVHDDVIKWEHFSRYWPFVRGIHRSPVNSPHKGQWRGALMFPLICARINAWVNNSEAGDLRRNHAHYDVTVKDHWIPLTKSQWCRTLAFSLFSVRRSWTNSRDAGDLRHWIHIMFWADDVEMTSHHMNQCWLWSLLCHRDNIMAWRNLLHY